MRLVIAIGVVAISIGLGIKFWPASGFKSIILELNGGKIAVSAVGSGPTVIVLKSPAGDINWESLPNHWSEKFRVLVVESAAVPADLWGPFLSKISIQSATLVASGEDTQTATVVASQFQALIKKIVIIDPRPGVLPLLPQPGLLLAGQDGMPPREVMRLSRMLGNAQTSLYPGPVGEMKQDMSWIFQRIQSFHDFVN